MYVRKERKEGKKEDTYYIKERKRERKKGRKYLTFSTKITFIIHRRIRCKGVHKQQKKKFQPIPTHQHSVLESV